MRPFRLHNLTSEQVSILLWRNSLHVGFKSFGVYAIANAPYAGSYIDNDISSGSYGTELCVVEASTKYSQLRVKDIRTNGSPKTVYARLFGSSVMSAVTGGFFGLSSKGDYRFRRLTKHFSRSFA